MVVDDRLADEERLDFFLPVDVPSQNGPADTAPPTPRVPKEARNGPAPKEARAPHGEIDIGPIPVDAPTPRLLTCTRAMRGPTDAPMPPRPTRTLAKLGPTEIPRVDIRATFGIRTPKTISELP